MRLDPVLLWPDMGTTRPALPSHGPLVPWLPAKDFPAEDSRLPPCAPASSAPTDSGALPPRSRATTHGTRRTQLQHVSPQTVGAWGRQHARWSPSGSVGDRSLVSLRSCSRQAGQQHGGARRGTCCAAAMTGGWPGVEESRAGPSSRTRRREALESAKRLGIEVFMDPRFVGRTPAA